MKPTNSHEKLTRRSVLQGLAAAALGAPYVVPGRALGLEDVPAASERITVGHIGVGNRGNALFREAQRAKVCQSVATSDCYQSRRESFAKIIGGKPYQNFRDLLARDDIDAVIIATPDHVHVPIGIEACRAGKDVYIEKPLGVTIEQDLAMQKVVQETGRIFQYGTQQRSMPHCWKGCELVRRGEIGKVHTIEVDAPNGSKGGATNEAPLPDGFDFDMWQGPAPMRPYTTDLCKPPGTYWVYSQSIGYLGGWGAHPLDIMVWPAHWEKDALITVEGTGEIPTEGLYDCVFNWDMTIMIGDIKVIFKPGADRTKFIGDKGWIQVARAQQRNAASDPALLPTGKQQVDATDDSLPVSVGGQMANFLQAVASRKPPVSHIRDAVRSDLISLLCDMAVRTGEKITWDATRQELVQPSAAAKALASRPMRTPWTL